MGSILLIGSASYSRYKELNFISLPLDILQNDNKLYEQLYDNKEICLMPTCENRFDNFCNYVFSCKYHL